MNLREWLSSPHTDRVNLDVIVQIAQICMNFSGSAVIRPENFEVSESDEGDGYFEVSYNKICDYDNTCRPVPECADIADEKDNIFCLGLLIYRIATGGDYDLSKAEMLSNMVEDENSFPFLSYESVYGSGAVPDRKIVWEITERATDLNREKRPSYEWILDRIISEFPSGAEIDIREKATGRVMETVNVALDCPLTVWKCREEYNFSGRVYIPEKLEQESKIPYRICVKKYICQIVPKDLPSPEKWCVSVLSGKKCVGIDFGTWNSSVSYVNSEGYTEDVFSGKGTIPTVVCYISENECIFGEEAVRHYLAHPNAVSRCFKRSIETAEKFTITAENGDIIEETYYSLTVKFLKYLYGTASEKLGLDSENSVVVLTVPACYDAGMKTTIYTASCEAGFEPVILTEPEAVAFFFGMRNECSGNALVFDMGGGTTDISIINFSGVSGDAPSVRSETIDGIGLLGGADLTEVLFSEFLKILKTRHGLDMSSETVSGLETHRFNVNRSELMSLAEEMKIKLSSEEKAEAETEIYFPNSLEKKKINFLIKRRQYEILIKDRINSLKGRIKNAVSKSGMKINSIKNVIVTGGASVTPAVRDMVFSLFSSPDCKLHYVDYGTAVSRGASIYANQLAEKKTERQSVSELTYDLGVLTAGAFGARPLFKPVASAGTSLREGGISVSAVCVPTEEETTGRYCRMFLYRRPPEYSHVESTFDPDGDVICPIGSLYAGDFPDDFDPSEGKIKFRIDFDEQECISSDVIFYMPEKRKGIAKFIPQRRGEPEYNAVGTRKAVFIPNAMSEKT